MADDFNMSLRKFLKQVGITSQQEVEAAVRSAREAGSLPDVLEAKVTLTIPGVYLTHTVVGRFNTGGDE